MLRVQYFKFVSFISESPILMVLCGGKFWLFDQDEEESCTLRYGWERRIGLQPKSFSLLCMNS